MLIHNDQREFIRIINDGSPEKDLQSNQNHPECKTCANMPTVRNRAQIIDCDNLFKMFTCGKWKLHVTRRITSNVRGKYIKRMGGNPTVKYNWVILFNSLYIFLYTCIY